MNLLTFEHFSENLNTSTLPRSILRVPAVLSAACWFLPTPCPSQLRKHVSIHPLMQTNKVTEGTKLFLYPQYGAGGCTSLPLSWCVFAQRSDCCKGCCHLLLCVSHHWPGAVTPSPWFRLETCLLNWQPNPYNGMMSWEAVFIKSLTVTPPQSQYCLPKPNLRDLFTIIENNHFLAEGKGVPGLLHRRLRPPVFVPVVSCTQAPLTHTLGCFLPHSKVISPGQRSSLNTAQVSWVALSQQSSQVFLQVTLSCLGMMLGAVVGPGVIEITHASTITGFN